MPAPSSARGVKSPPAREARNCERSTASAPLPPQVADVASELSVGRPILACMATGNHPRPRWTRLDGALAPFDALSVEVLARAALDSPSASHWAAATGLVWARALARPPRGTVVASAEDLPKLVDAGVAAWPEARNMSDWWPSDPRLVVSARVRNGRVRLHPGRVVEPLRLVRRLERIAFATDDAVYARHGFRVSDLVEVGLRLADLQVTGLAPTWSQAALPEPPLLRIPGASPFDVAEQVRAIPPVVTSEEITVAGRLRERDLVADATELCTDPTAAAAACEWATTTVRQAHQPDCLVVTTDAGLVPVPASIVLEALGAATGRLAVEVADEPGVREGWAYASAADLWEVFGLPFVDDETSMPIGGMLRIAERHLASIDLVAELAPASVQPAAEKAVHRAASRAIAEAAAATGVATDISAEMLRLVVIDAAGRLERLSGGEVIAVTADEFTRVLSDAADGPNGQDDAWDFLLDLQRVPRTVELHPPDLVDASRHWREHGWLVPPELDAVAVPDAAVIFGWLGHDPSWPEAAQWDATERILDAASLPPKVAFWARDLDDRGVATLWAPPAMTGGRPTCYALHPDGLVIGATGDLPGAGIPDGAGALPIVVATALRDALFARPAAVAALNLDASTPKRVLVGVDLDEGDGIAVATADGLPPVIFLGPMLLAATAAEPIPMHRALGAALASALRLGYGDVDMDAFTAAWNVGPVALVAGVRAGPVDRSPRRELPRTRAARMRAHKAHAAAVRAAGGDLAPGELTGDEAAEICQRLLIPSADRALRDAIARFDRDLLLRAAATWADEAHAHRAQLRDRLDLALAAPWRDEVLADPSDYEDDPDQTRPLHVLIETAIAANPAPESAGVAPDRLDLAGLAEQARLVAWIGAASDGYRRGLNTLTVTVGPGALTGVSMPASGSSIEATVDMAAYVAASSVDALAAAADDARLQDPDEVERLLAEADGTERPFERFTDLPDQPGSLRSLDETMRVALGAGFGAISAVLRTCIDMAPPPIGVLPEPIPVAILRDDIAGWSMLPSEEITAAIRLLTIDSDLARGDRTGAWEVERRDARLNARPLIAVDDGLLVLPHLCTTARDIFLGRLADGRLPWPVRDERLRLAVDAYRRHVTAQLESTVGEKLSELGLPHVMNVKENRAAALGIPGLPGEIDALVVDVASETLWVIEVKHARRAVGAGEIRERVEKFVKPKGFIDVLLRKTATVAAHASAAALVAGVTEARSWRVVPLFVTADVEPAAFATPQRVQFATPRTLAAALTGKAS